MRVIGGSARGRALRAPKGAELRPTSDRVREAIFDVLGHLDVIEGAEVLDLFAGTGAFGIEALSRGAAGAIFVESVRSHAEAIRANLEATGLSGLQHRVVTSDVFSFLGGFSGAVDVAFADPPYAFAEWPRLLEQLPGALVVLESPQPIELDSAHELHRLYRYGGTLLTVAWRTEASRNRSVRGGGSPGVTSAIFPGSFDPFHNGHYEIVERAHRVFARVVVAVLRNSQKSDPLFDAEEREKVIASCLSGFSNVEVVSMSTLVVDVAREVGVDVIVRGLRAVSDFENELQMAQMNHELSGIETLFVPTGATYSFISSRLVREVASFGGDISRFVPEPVAIAMRERFGE